MATNGVYGFRKNGEDKLSYNHSDSYPSCLGDNIATFIKNHTDEELNKLYNRLILVDESTKVKDLSEEDFAKCIPYIERNKDYFSYDTATQTFNDNMDMYSFLHKFMGNPEEYMKNQDIPFLTESNNFIKSSLFCEWGYIINLDTKTLEVWKGFQTEEDLTNRYGNSYCVAYSGDKYYPCKMIVNIPFEEVRKENFHVSQIV